MEFLSGAIIIAVVFFLVILIVLAKKKAEFVINFVLRGIVGTTVIYFVNEVLLYYGLSYAIGINPITVLTSGTLGFPGVLLLYGINLYKIL